jgi:Family of unknown function (DUF6186)
LAGDPVTPYTVLLAGYVGVFAVALLLDGYARANHGPIRPIATVLDAAVATRAGRCLVWAAWFWVGFHFLAR